MMHAPLVLKPEGNQHQVSVLSFLGGLKWEWGVRLRIGLGEGKTRMAEMTPAEARRLAQYLVTAAKDAEKNEAARQRTA